jgi:drug/metabolite transporter superfamily protein YnfA
MEMYNTVDQIRKARMIFWINVLFSVLSLAVLVKTIVEHKTYKIVAAAAGCLVFISFAILVFLEIKKLRKKAAGPSKEQ